MLFMAPAAPDPAAANHDGPLSGDQIALDTCDESIRAMGAFPSPRRDGYPE
jgi:hypothetical protein